MAASSNAGGPAGAAPENMVAVEQAARPKEEINALYAGFAIGLMVGFFFLVYIIVAAWNPPI